MRIEAGVFRSTPEADMPVNSHAEMGSADDAWRPEGFRHDQVRPIRARDLFTALPLPAEARSAKERSQGPLSDQGPEKVYRRAIPFPEAKEADMTQRIPENFSAAEWRLVTFMGNTMPPRDPNDDDDDDDDDEEEDNDTESDEPPVVREPDEDE